MATVSASPQPPHMLQGQEQEYYDEQNYAEVSYSEQGGPQEATIEQWRTLQQACKSVGSILKVDDELQSLSEAEQIVQAQDEKREAIIERLQLEGDALKKELKKAKLDALRPANQPTEMAHNAEVDRLERDYTQCGKQLKEEEAGVSRKQSELSRWKVDKEEVGKIQVGDEGAWADGKVIRLKLFTDAGFTLVPGEENSPAKLIISDEAKTDIHTVSLDHSRSKTQNANFIWGLAGE